MNEQTVTPEMKKHLKFLYMIHILISLILLLIHGIVYDNLTWMNKGGRTTFFIEMIILLFCSLFILVIFILITKLKLTLTQLFVFKMMTKFGIFFTVLNGLFISIVTYSNAQLLRTFYDYCPFSYSQNVFLNSKTSMIKPQECKNPRCFSIDKDKINISNITNYICNIKVQNTYIKCFVYNQNNNDINVINGLEEHINYCQKHTKFYSDRASPFF